MLYDRAYTLDLTSPPLPRPAPSALTQSLIMNSINEPTLTYPPDWEDEERMHFLLGPFPPTALLSVADQKVRFWSSLVSSTCRLLRQPVFSERQMAQR